MNRACADLLYERGLQIGDGSVLMICHDINNLPVPVETKYYVTTPPNLPGTFNAKLVHRDSRVESVGCAKFLYLAEL